MPALRMIQLHGLLLDGLKACVVNLHDGTWVEKMPILQQSIFTGEIGLPLSRLHCFENPLKNSMFVNQNTKQYSISTGKFAWANWRYNG
jgi:hypothetical protein